MSALPTRWLSCHVTYACRHAGACCRSGWPLPVERGVVAAIERAVADGAVRAADGVAAWLDDAPAAPDDVRGVLRQVGGGCVFHTPAGDGPRSCAVHRALGHAALPAACQHFPRLCLIDARGVRVSLSHYCPTAAAMLVDDDAPVTIVDGPSAVPGRDVPEGLDARGELPPRLTERVLMDFDGLTAWEAHVVDVLAGPASEGSPERALARVAADAERLTAWTPSSGTTLADAVAALGHRSDPEDLDRAAARFADARTWPAWFDLGATTCRAPWWPEAPPDDLTAADARWVAPVWAAHDAPVRRYLAARAFAAWITWQADAARALAAWLTLCHAVLRVECARACAAAAAPLDRARLVAAVRRADLLLVHYADSLAVARALAPAAGAAR